MLFDKSAGARFHLGALIVDHLGSTVRLFRPGGLAVALALVAGVTATTSAVAEGTKTVSYRGYQVAVPADWPVVDLTADPTACVRLDQPAVYLGRSTSQAKCPAHLVGRSSGLILEPLTTNTPSSDGLLRRTVTDAGVLATAYYAPGAERAASDVTAICVLAAPEGVARLRGSGLPVRVVTASVDERLNDSAYIVPGLGDAGDRLFGAV